MLGYDQFPSGDDDGPLLVVFGSTLLLIKETHTKHNELRWTPSDEISSICSWIHMLIRAYFLIILDEESLCQNMKDFIHDLIC